MLLLTLLFFQIPEILSLFIFQTSRWQFLKCLQDAVDEASRQESETSRENSKEVEEKKRRRDNLTRVAKAVRRQISGYEVFDVTKEGQLGSNHAAPKQKPVHNRFGEIKGIPKAAGVGQDGHIY